MNRDIVTGIIVSLLAPASAVLLGDALFLGLRYYFVVPTVLILFCLAFQVRRFFCSGAAVALSASYFVYLPINWLAERPDGLLGLGHLASLPGAFIGFVLALYLQRRIQTSPVVFFLLGFSGLAAGFLVNQLVVCKTLMWCGPLG